MNAYSSYFARFEMLAPVGTCPGRITIEAGKYLMKGIGEILKTPIVESCCRPVNNVFWDEKFLVTDAEERRRIKYNPRQYAWHLEDQGD